MKPIKSYVIRIYRRDAEALAGVIEDVRTRRTAAFKSLAELWQVLSGRRSAPQPRKLGFVQPSQKTREPRS